ncbi:MAG: hypothetical protein BWK79_03585 [Beggiatoa sp. IS2]|nr:MAG: hypothetical protein BWK79_03585 [Beggiatoa sp. IS2]
MFKAIKNSSLALVLVTIIGLGLSLLAFLYVQAWESDEYLRAKQKQTDDYVRTLRLTLTTFGHILQSIRGLRNVLENFNQEDFGRFVRHELQNYPSIEALIWIPQVPAAKVGELQQQVQSLWNQEFHIWEFREQAKYPVSERATYYPILLTEPLATDNAQVVGFDVGSHEVLRAALERAQDQGQLAVSGVVDWSSISHSYAHLLGNKEEGVETALKTRSFWAFLPVYRANTEPQTVLERQQNLVGFAVSVFAIDTMLETVLRLPKLRTPVFLQVFDETPGEKAQEIYLPAWYVHNTNIPVAEIKLSSPTSLEFGGRQWRLALTKVLGDEHMPMGYAWIVLTIGIVFTFGLWRYLYVTLNRALWAEELVVKRTVSLTKANAALNQEIKARELITQALNSSRQRFQAVFDEAPVGIVQTDLNGKILASNKAFQEMLDCEEEDLQGRLLRLVAHPQDADNDQDFLQKMLQGIRDNYVVNKRYRCKGGQVVWTNQSCSIVREANPPFIISMVEDVTERKCAEDARIEAEKKYKDIFENSVEGIFQCTPTGYFLSVNPAFVRIFGYSSAAQMLSEIHEGKRQLYANAERCTEFLQLLEMFSEIQDFEYEARRRDGNIIWINETVWVVRDEDTRIRYYEGIIEDVSERKRIEAQLRYDASHDQLTGLINRAAFTTRLSKALNHYQMLVHSEQSATNGYCPLITDFAVLFVDLDRFKIVNDSMGHLVGDQMLTEVARRLTGETVESDTVARFGGDEFAITLANLDDLIVLEQRVERIQHALNQSYLVENESFNTTASIGIALASSRYTTAEEMIRDADTAMYEAKKQGRNKSVIFQPGMHTRVVNLLRMESDLRKALERDEFSVYYQPIVSLENLQTIGLEALVRWRHPERGLISPDQFIPIAEETGLIIDLGLWVFETACKQLQCWKKQFPEQNCLGMNINVSPVQLKQPGLAIQVQDIIEKTGINDKSCHVEITENAVMEDPEGALAVLRDLKDLQVLLYVDDFGTGYSSLSYLQKFPIDALKIDKSFIKAINTSIDQTQIVHAIIALGKAFNLKVVAEGVENDYQLSVLQAASCHQVQGYFFSPPKDSQTIENYLRNEYRTSNPVPFSGCARTV